MSVLRQVINRVAGGAGAARGRGAPRGGHAGRGARSAAPAEALRALVSVRWQRSFFAANRRALILATRALGD
jgi:hypothetical protein